jgi:hypothetical protein
MEFPICPLPLPENLEALAQKLSEEWVKSTFRPLLSQDLIEKWDKVIIEWSESGEIPLLIRKRKNNIGSEIKHKDGRIIIPTDNSPAQWVFTEVYNKMDIDLKAIREILENDKLPISFAPSKDESERSKYKCTLGTKIDLNKRGWKLCHINPVGLKTRTPLQDLSIDILKDRFIRFLSPSNMFLVPKKWSGLGEFPEMVKLLGGVDAKEIRRDYKLLQNSNSSSIRKATTKDKTKYRLNGIRYHKNGLVLAVLTQYLNQNPCNYNKLKEVFPDEIQGNYGVFTRLEAAQRKNLLTNGKRYFIDNDSILKTSDGISIAVCTQWAAGKNIEKFISLARKLNFTVIELPN